VDALNVPGYPGIQILMICGFAYSVMAAPGAVGRKLSR
jgi:hypothetical protein